MLENSTDFKDGGVAYLSLGAVQFVEACDNLPCTGTTYTPKIQKDDYFMRKDRGQKKHLSRGCPNAIAPPFTLTYIYQIVLILATHLTGGQKSNLIPGEKLEPDGTHVSRDSRRDP